MSSSCFKLDPGTPPTALFKNSIGTTHGLTRASFRGPWDKNNLSPWSRQVEPVRVLNEQHKVIQGYGHGPRITLSNRTKSMVVCDFGKEVGGVLSVNYSASGSGKLGVAFTEALNFTGPVSDNSNGGTGSDGALYADISAPKATSGSYTTPYEKMRGGFRYAIVFIETNGTLDVTITGVAVYISFQPNWSNLRAYGGYFDSSDELLNRIWYASAYTIQTTTIPPHTGRVWPNPADGWLNNADLQVNGTSVLVDGAKRDRAVWAGDLGIASARNAVQVLYDFQNATTGEFPMVTPPISFYGSDTYHLITMIATHDFILYSNDMAFLNQNFEDYKKAMTFILSKVDETGLLNVTGASNWGRKALDAGRSTDGNMLLYGALTTGVSLAQWLGEQELAREWEAVAVKLKAPVNSPSYNWDPKKGAFKNTDIDASIHPEDGNSMALYFGGANTSYEEQISNYLPTNWNSIGAITPEQPGNIVPFIEGYEVNGHFRIHQTQRALDLIRRSWGWYLNNPYGTRSMMIEGYYEDGSFRYANDPTKEGSYPSHAHGWSTAPAEALISYVVGLRPTAPGGKTWVLEPQMGDLENAQGGFTTPTGKFSASWEVERGGYRLTYDTPSGTSGIVRVRSSRGKPGAVLLDGRRVDGVTFDRRTGLTESKASGGRHTVVLRY
ncbi:glycoside hydrolase family 78 protein [Zasmidium cellare ATCC 36951]|uniref:Glycoside hydrolase family 78 protein n=1 Tax=Zasmidium cellare ATCC 36951 TaxID=1080233 RepID=A0A6A6CDY3_ZASCE|nr:glycoside hydrolase family 78 protein [Zasmidium cellare ATCC 36951]KAF2164440.1 glycoside hydrolase family 78 protein [Zasmidium cellare ATCC 36951]